MHVYNEITYFYNLMYANKKQHNILKLGQALESDIILTLRLPLIICITLNKKSNLI
jgi:hypothetical protein